MSEISMGTMYEINKTAMLKEPMLNNFSKANTMKKLENYFFQIDKDYALLCRERYDFTVFRIRESKYQATIDLRDVLENRGEIISIDEQKDNSYEIWLKIDEEAFMYKLFPCDWVIDC